MKNRKEEYVAPEVDVVECVVERGFQASAEFMQFSLGGEEQETASTKEWWFDK